MTATNHALTGTLIGLCVSNPVLAVVLAFGSHFVLDSLPHFGDDNNKLNLKFNGRLFQAILFTDIALCLFLAGALFIGHPAHWFVLILCAFVATSPDFAWFPDYLAAVRHKRKPNYGPLRSFASKIQWSQTLFGALPEVAWASAMFFMVIMKIK